MSISDVTTWRRYVIMTQHFLVRRKRSLIIVAGVLVVLYILCSHTGHQFVHVGSTVYPGLRIAAGTGEKVNISKTGIPHIIHQTWKTGDIPQPLVRWVGSWRRHHAQWEYWFWTDEDIARLVHESFPQYKHLFDAFPETGYRADAFRYLVLYLHGGVYADLDVENLKPLDSLANTQSCILSQEPEEHAYFLAPVGTPLVSNALMACRPRHAFMSQVIHRLSHNAGWFGWNDILHATGPYMLTKEYHTYRANYGFPSAHPSKALYLATADLFQPLVDQSMLDIMRRNCLPGQGPAPGYFVSADFVERWGRICEKVMSRSLLDRPPSESLTVHHFTHLWAGEKYDPRGVFNAREASRVQDIIKGKLIL